MEMKARCECSDPGCPNCKGSCERAGWVRLFRVDMHDVSGVLFCERCSDDAFYSGVFCCDDPAEGARLRCACGALATWKDLDPESGFVARVCCAQHAFDGSVRMNGSEC